MSTQKQNQIADRLRGAFFDYYGWEPPESEIRSWRNSLRALSNAIELGGLEDHGVLLEMQLPLTSKRLDAMITGHDRDGRAGAVIVELTQWSDDVEPSRVEDMVTVRYGKGRKEQRHPSAQVGQYRQYLADSHDTSHDGVVQLKACAYLHDFHHDVQAELANTRMSRDRPHRRPPSPAARVRRGPRLGAVPHPEEPGDGACR